MTPHTAQRTTISRKVFANITRDEVILLIREWFDVYGEPPRELDWNPSKAEAQGFDAVARKFEKDACWPPYSVVRRLFGSFSEGIIAAGLYPRRQSAAWLNLPDAQRADWLRAAVRLRAATQGP